MQIPATPERLSKHPNTNGPLSRSYLPRAMPSRRFRGSLARRLAWGHGRVLRRDRQKASFRRQIGQEGRDGLGKRARFTVR